MSNARADIITGTVSSLATAGFSFTHDVYPIISEIGVIAGAIVAVHGLVSIIIRTIKTWKSKH